LAARARPGDLIHNPDRGSECTSIRYTDRLGALGTHTERRSVAD
jgi:hypothetical protein